MSTEPIVDAWPVTVLGFTSPRRRVAEARALDLPGAARAEFLAANARRALGL